MYDLQKASLWKRISAALCDLIIIGIVVIGMALLLSALLGYDGQVDLLEDISERYEAEYNVDFDISNEDYQKLTNEEQDRYKPAMDAFSKDPEANYIYNLLVNYTFVIITISILVAFLLLELIVPLLFGNGQTIGKKIFGVAVMREDGVKISPMILFVRSILGKYTVETMGPVLVFLMIYWDIIGFFGTLILLGMLVLQLTMLATTKERRALHDKLSHTVVVDYASQMIFETPEDLIAYKKRIHAEQIESERD